MDLKFHAAIDAIKSGEPRRLQDLLRQDLSLTADRSRTSHPTLLDYLILEGGNSPNSLEMAAALVDAGASLNGPLVTCASCDNVAVAAILLDHGAAVNGTGGWSPLEEALYWNSQKVKSLLLERGAAVSNLRVAAGLGRTDAIEAFFDSDNALTTGAGSVNWPWGDPDAIRQSNLDQHIREKLLSKVRSWVNDDQDVINNAFVYACMHGHINAATLLLKKGAQINALPGGFDFSGTALHYAALNGHQVMVEFLLRNGADPNIKDTKVGQSPAGWAEYSKHAELRAYLDRAAGH